MRMVYMYVCVHICVQVEAGGRYPYLPQLLYLPAFFPQGLSLNLESLFSARLAGQWLPGSSSAGVTGVHGCAWLFPFS